MLLFSNKSLESLSKPCSLVLLSKLSSSSLLLPMLFLFSSETFPGFLSEALPQKCLSTLSASRPKITMLQKTLPQKLFGILSILTSKPKEIPPQEAAPPAISKNPPSLSHTLLITTKMLAPLTSKLPRFSSLKLSSFPSCWQPPKAACSPKYLLTNSEKHPLQETPLSQQRTSSAYPPPGVNL